MTDPTPCTLLRPPPQPPLSPLLRFPLHEALHAGIICGRAASPAAAAPFPADQQHLRFGPERTRVPSAPS
ncbi:hypothetical protein NL676_016168 [Syzygium grande]|nr:hypothetical protein NL676_016168 [Syzygium grande]